MSGMYLLGDDHWFADMRRAWLILVRAHCTCGWASRPYWNPDAAADALFFQPVPERDEGVMSERRFTDLSMRQDYIYRMAWLAKMEPAEFHDGDDLVTRTMHYAGSARPRVTKAEVEEVLRLTGTVES